MSKYRLCYKLNGIIKYVDLSKLDCLKGKDTTNIKTIDNFTASFENIENLVEFLKKNNLLDESINKLFIGKDKKDKESNETYRDKIYKGEFLFFKKNSNYLDLSFLCKIIRENIRDGKFVVKMAETYYHKYNKTRIGPSHINCVLNIIINLATLINKNGYDSLTNGDKETFVDCIDDFIIFEFYKYNYDHFNARFSKVYDDKGSVKNYVNIRTFAIYLMEYFKILEYKKDKKEVEIQKSCLNYDDHEEFLTYEDFERLNNEILSTYESDGKPIIEGHDIIKPLTKRELKMELNNIANELVNKGNTYH